MDPLDILMIILAVILTLAGYCIYIGYALIVVCVLGSFVAYCFYNAPARTFPTAEEITDVVDLTGKIAFVSGTTSGIGIDTAHILALRGVKVYLAARSEQKLQESKKQMLTHLADRASISSRSFNKCDDMIVPIICDLNDLTSVKKAAEKFLNEEGKLVILINNAVEMTVPESRPTAQGSRTAGGHLPCWTVLPNKDVDSCPPKRCSDLAFVTYRLSKQFSVSLSQLQ